MSLSVSSQIVQPPTEITALTYSPNEIVGGFAPGWSYVNKFGRNPDISAGTAPEDVWNGGGFYTGFPSQVETVQVFSSSATDDTSSTGAHSIRITGLDTNWDVLSETITLDGMTPVNSVNQFRRVHTAQVVTAGSGGVNVGTITCRHTTTTANVFFVMPIGNNQTNVCAYTVPAGFTGYIQFESGNIRAASTTAQVQGYYWTRSFGGVFRGRRPFGLSTSINVSRPITGGLVLTEKSDVVVRLATVVGNNIDVIFAFDLLLIPNS